MCSDKTKLCQRQLLELTWDNEGDGCSAQNVSTGAVELSEERCLGNSTCSLVRTEMLNFHS